MDKVPMNIFSKRIPEPKNMGKIKLQAFEALSIKNYSRWIIPFVDDVLETSGLTSGRILDIACGPGFLFKEFARRSKNFQVYGIDISPYAISLSKKRRTKYGNVIFQYGSAERIPFGDALFDLVVCKDSIHEFADIKIALEEMLRVVKNEGFVYIQDLRRDLPRYLLRRSIPPDTIVKKLQFYSTRAAYTQQEFRSLLKTLCIKRYRLRTRKVTKRLKKKYLGIVNCAQLKEAFQARFVAVIKKPLSSS